MIDGKVTSVVKLILCKINLVISQRQAHFRQFNGMQAYFSVSFFNDKSVVSD